MVFWSTAGFADVPLMPYPVGVIGLTIPEVVMTEKKKNSPRSQFNATSFPGPAQIREQAERRAQSIKQPDFSSMTPEEIQQQFNELQVKQIEAALQIEQLRGRLEAYKDVEKELLKNRNLLEGIINGIPDVLAIQLPDHTIERYNKAGYDMLSMTPEAVVGRKCYELIGRERECDGCPTRKALQSGKMEKTEKYVPELGAYTVRSWSGTKTARL